MRPGDSWAPGESQGGTLHHLMPTTTWKKKRFILPRLCYVSLKWTGFFAIMYVGTRYYPLSNETTTWLVRPEVYLFKKLKGEDIID